MDRDSIIQAKWRDGYVLAVNGVTWGGGRVLLLECLTARGREGTRLSVAPLAETTVDSILGFSPQRWTAVTELASCLDGSASLRFSAGEGSMGADGYVAATQVSDGSLLWVAFFDCSNPFLTVRIDGQRVIAVSSLDFEWSYPIDRPESVAVRNLR